MNWLEVIGIISICVVIAILIGISVGAMTRQERAGYCVMAGFMDYIEWKSIQFCVGRDDGQLVLVPYEVAVEATE